MIQKRILAITSCLVMVTAFAVTGAVTAAPTDNAAIRHFYVPNPLLKDHGTVYGKLTIDTNSGQYAINMNPAKLKSVYSDSKSDAKEAFRQKQYIYEVILTNTKTPGEVSLGWLALSNNGGNIHGEGTLDPSVVSSDDLAKIAGWNPDDVFVGFKLTTVP